MVASPSDADLVDSPGDGGEVQGTEVLVVLGTSAEVHVDAEQEQHALEVVLSNGHVKEIVSLVIELSYKSKIKLVTGQKKML